MSFILGKFGINCDKLMFLILFFGIALGWGIVKFPSPWVENLL